MSRPTGANNLPPAAALSSFVIAASISSLLARGPSTPMESTTGTRREHVVEVPGIMMCHDNRRCRRSHAYSLADPRRVGALYDASRGKPRRVSRHQRAMIDHRKVPPELCPDSYHRKHIRACTAHNEM